MTITTFTQTYRLLRLGIKRESAMFCYVPSEDGYRLAFNFNEPGTVPAWSMDQLWQKVSSYKESFGFSTNDSVSEVMEALVGAIEENEK